MLLSDLLYTNEYFSLWDAKEINVTSIVSNTKENVKGSVFVCIKGEHFDAHQMILPIYENGAAAIVIQKGCIFEKPSNIPLFEVEDSRRTLAYMWNRFCHDPASKLQFIGITGTNGKTTTSYVLHHILTHAAIKAGLIGTITHKIGELDYIPTYNEKDNRLSTMTTPDPDLLYPMLEDMVKKGVKYVIMEVSSHALLLEKVAPIHFHISVFTNLTPEHLDTHGSFENYLLSKSKLFNMSDIGLFNADDISACSLRKASIATNFTYALKSEANFGAKNYLLNGLTSSTFTYASEKHSYTITAPLCGLYNVYNCLAATAAAELLGIEATTVKKALLEMKKIPGRMEKIDTDTKEFEIYIDFAHTEYAMRNLLLTIRAGIKEDQRLVVLFGCGGDRDKSKRDKMGACAMELSDFAIITSDNARSEDPKMIVSDILKGFPNASKRRVILSREKAIEYAIYNAKKGDVIVLVGKGHEKYELFGTEKKDFDERKIVLKAIEKRKRGYTT